MTDRTVSVRLRDGTIIADRVDPDTGLEKAQDAAMPGLPAEIYDADDDWTLARVWSDGGVDVVGRTGRMVYGSLVSS